MITHDFTVSRETFAATRKKVLTDAADQLRPHIKDALNRVGLPSWEIPVIAAAADLFKATAAAEVDAWGPVLDDMAAMFRHDLGEALKLTKASSNPAHQLETLTGWIAQMAHNAGIEAATTSDAETHVGLEWVTMHDPEVRSVHAAVDGQTVPTGHEFDVGGTKLLYPGQPKGDPSVWISCRCLARPTMLGKEMAADTLTAAGDVSRETFAGQGNASDPGLDEGEDPKAAVVVLRPRTEDPVTAIASGTHPHCTLLYLGDGTVDLGPLQGIVESIAQSIGHPMTDKVSGRAVLGADNADVLLLDASGSGAVRAALLAEDGVLELLGMQEQFPAWIPHLTIGYPEAPAEAGEMPADITYDLLSIWRGNETYDYPLGEAMPTPDPKAPDAVTAAMEDAVPVPAGPAAAAPAAPAETVQLRPWHGVLAPEGAPSGDKRGFAAKMLTMRDLPLPLKAQFVDDEGHKGSVVVGRIDEVYRDGGLIKASGVWDNTAEADKAWGMIDRKMWRGVSVDLDAAEGEMIEAAKEGDSPSIEFTQGRVCSSTLCAIPAFAEAFIRNGTWAEFADEPMPSGAMVEIPDWSTAPKTPALSLVASAAPKVSADYFRNPMLEEPTPLTLGEEGHIFGHLAAWEACHIAYEVCTTAPASETDYAYFLTGQVFSDAGPVAVGQITLGGGHADGRLGMRAAMAHYDNVATAVADITVGEDAHGVWFSGKLRDWTTEQQLHELFAAGLSGDWRGVRFRGSDSMELVAAHAVNVQGFPIPRPKFSIEGTRQLSLVAAGMVRDRERDVESVFAELRGMQFADVVNEITAMKGK